MRILTLLLRYKTDKYAGAEEEVDAIFARQLPGVRRTTVIVDSSLPNDHVEIDGPERTILGSENTFSEWSAADRGLAFVGERIWSYDLVHIATAAFQTLYTSYLERFTLPVLRLLAEQSACLGHIDCYNEPVRLRSFHSQHWLRTSFLFAPPAELKALRTMVSFRDASIFSGSAEEPFRGDAPLSKNYQEYIQSWLLGSDIGQGVSWHSGFRLTPQSLPNFQQKTMAILNEHMLSIRLRAQGCRIVDTTWLATRLAEHPNQAIPWDLGWRAQLSGRAQDKLVVPASAFAARA